METKNNPTTQGPIETALAEQNITAQVIAKLKTDYSGLKINGIDDKEGFKRVEDARKECKAVRILAEKICKSGREEAILIQKAWISKEKEVVGQIKEVESELEQESERIKKEKEEVLFKAAQEAKLPMRKEKLASIGVEVLDSELLKLDDLQFSQLFTEFYEKHLKEKAEAIRKKEEAERLKKEEEERKEKAEKLQIHNNRKEVLLPFWKFVPNEIIIKDLSTLTDEEFQDVFKTAFEAKEEYEEEQKALEEENKRLAAEKAKSDALLKQQEEKAAKEKAEAEARQKELEQQLAKKKAEEEAAKKKTEAEAKAKAEEEKKLAKAPDKDRLKLMIERATLTVSVNEFKTEEASKMESLIIDKFNAFKKWAFEQIETI